jgi:hypothetical protein
MLLYRYEAEGEEGSQTLLLYALCRMCSKQIIVFGQVSVSAVI